MASSMDGDDLHCQFVSRSRRIDNRTPTANLAASIKMPSVSDRFISAVTQATPANAILALCNPKNGQAAKSLAR